MGLVLYKTEIKYLKGIYDKVIISSSKMNIVVFGIKYSNQRKN